MNELEIMKEQLELMKEKLNSQAIINNRLLRSSIRERLSWTKRYTYVEIFLLLPFIYFMYAGMTYQIGLSWWLYAYTVFMCTVCVGLDFWINNIYISRRDYQNKNLLMLGKKIARQKQLRWNSLLFGMILFFPWFCWLGYELHNHIPANEWTGIFIGLIVGTVIGLVIGLAILLRMQRTNENLLDEINDIEDEGEMVE